MFVWHARYLYFVSGSYRMRTYIYVQSGSTYCACAHSEARYTGRTHAVHTCIMSTVATEVLGPRPSLAIVSFWQGITEIGLRVANIVSDFTYNSDRMDNLYTDQSELHGNSDISAGVGRHSVCRRLFGRGHHQWH